MTTPKTERYAFEPFGTVAGVLSGDPIRIFPEGKFYRDSRTLNITKDRLQEFAANIKQGLPRFEIPINLEHDKSLGRYGSIHDLEYMDKGPDGPGLYATKYRFTEEGRKLIEQEKFKGVSGEAVWTLFDNAKYQDPVTNKQVDNLLVGMALTNSSFFGKEVQLFSADAPTPKRKNGYTALREKMKAMFGSLMGELETVLGPDADDDSVPDKSALTLTTETLATTSSPAITINVNSPPTTPVADHPKGKETMTQPTTPSVTAAPETKPISAEEFAAVKAQADKVARLEEMFTALKAEKDTFAADLKSERRARRLDQLTQRVDKFMALPEKTETLAAHLMTLEELSADEFKYFLNILETADKALTQGDLFKVQSQRRTGEGGEPDTYEAFAEKLLKDEFGGKVEKWSEAYHLAAEQRPDLFSEYNARFRVGAQEE